nr:putative reverse transcriptase domain-containing protein [Tanacetum cinerariifolium]
MVNARHKEVLKGSTSKEVGPSASDADHGNSGSSSSFEDLYFTEFTDEETKVLSSMLSRQVGKAIKNVMPYYISQTTDHLKVVQKELEEFKKEGIIKDFRNEMATYHDFTTCDVPKFNGTLDSVASTRWLSIVEGAFLTSCCKEKNKVNFASIFLRDSAKMWWDGKVYEKDDLLSRARIREANLLRRKYKETKETNRKLKFRDRILRSLSMIMVEEVLEPKLRHHVESVIKLILESVGENLQGHKLNESPNPKAIETNTLKSIKEEKAGVLNLKACVKNLFAPPNKLPFPLEVEIADSKVVVVINVYRDVEIEIDDSIFRINLIPITLGVFDIVIGIDWVDKYNASILCSQKLVRVVNPQGREIIIYDNKRKGNFKLCFVKKARKYLSHGCYAFMAHVIDTSFEKKSAKDVLVVNKFLDVFPEDLSGIPPKSQVKFRIDLITSATPIAKTAYRLAPSEMKELTSQLQELLNKGFIRPSSSPWGALILFVKKKDGSMGMCIDYRIK